MNLDLVRKLERQCWDFQANCLDAEKFTAAIVEECAAEILRWQDEPFPFDPEFGASLIKQHFGIKP